jgi:hypothetical protein
MHGQAGYEKDGSFEGINPRGYDQTYGPYEAEKRVQRNRALICRPESIQSGLRNREFIKKPEGQTIIWLLFF